VLAQQRQAAILNLIRRTGGAKVGHLVRQFGVSDMTIRRDLEALADRGLVAKVHGGATITATSSADEPGFEAKSVRQRAQKEAIAAYAASLVLPGTAVALSAGTTTAAMAGRLADIRGLTIVTNSLPAAETLHRANHEDQTVVLTGGIRTRSDALTGPVTEAAIASLNVDLLFLGVHGMSVRSGFTTPNLLEAVANRLLVAAARRIVVLADATKWDTVGVATIAQLEAADILITDDGIADAARTELAARVGELVVVTAAHQH